MKEPSPRSSRLALAGAVAATIMVAGFGFMIGRAMSDGGRGEVSQAVRAPMPTRAPVLEPGWSGILGRADLIRLAAAAADDASGGSAVHPDLGRIDGRRFELRLPFGCYGPDAETSDTAMGWQYDASDNALRLRVEPSSWTAQQWLSGDTAVGVDTIEGFWIIRPWTSSETCPVEKQRAARSEEPVTLERQTLALGQIFYSDGARAGRRDGEPFEATVRISEDRLEVSGGLTLRISGRISAAPGAAPIHCRQPEPAEQRPLCLVSAVLDELAIENPASQKTLAIWSLGGRPS